MIKYRRPACVGPLRLADPNEKDGGDGGQFPEDEQRQQIAREDRGDRRAGVGQRGHVTNIISIRQGKDRGQPGRDMEDAPPHQAQSGRPVRESGTNRTRSSETTVPLRLPDQQMRQADQRQGQQPDLLAKADGNSGINQAPAISSDPGGRLVIVIVHLPLQERTADRGRRARAEAKTADRTADRTRRRSPRRNSRACGSGRSANSRTSARTHSNASSGRMRARRSRPGRRRSIVSRLEGSQGGQNGLIRFGEEEQNDSPERRDRQWNHAQSGRFANRPCRADPHPADTRNRRSPPATGRRCSAAS